ncbi:MAG: SDR family oxidoreductase [bacterium]
MTNQPNPTALITGASSGIGEAFAHRLAERGYNLILVARRKEKLDSLAADLGSLQTIRVEVHAADLATEKGIASVEKKIGGGVRVDLLINSAGFGTTGAFHEVDIEKQSTMMKLQMEAPVRLTRAVLSGMLERRSGGIINLSSISSFFPAPNRTLYGAIKAAMNQFSRSLDAEVGRFGIRVQCLAPGFTYTEFHDSSEFAGWSRSQVSKRLWMTADQVARISLLELSRGKRVIVIPGWKNRLVVFLNTNPITWPIMKAAMSRRLNDPINGKN